MSISEYLQERYEHEEVLLDNLLGYPLEDREDMLERILNILQDHPYRQVPDFFNDAIALDYSVPFRLARDP